MLRGSKFVFLALALVAVLLPGAALAQTPDRTTCGLQMPVSGGDAIMLQQPADLGQNDKGVINYSAVRGSILHMDGPLALLQLDGAGVGNATSNQELAGNGMAVVRLPDDCNPGDFGSGAQIMAIGTPTEAGILDAVQVTPA